MASARRWRAGCWPVAARRNVLLSTPETNGEANRAWRLYRRLGFTDVIRGYHFAGDPRAFAILGRALPLTPKSPASPGSVTGRFARYRITGSGTMTWCAPALPRLPSPEEFTARRRQAASWLIAMLLLLVPLATGCLRVRASLTISPDDLVSGEIIAAAKPKNPKDPGPQLDSNLPFSQKVAVSNYDSDGYVGSQAVFSDLTFAEVPQLAHMNRRRRRGESVAAPKRQPGDPGRPGRSDIGDRPRRRRRVDRRLPRRR